eukprot:scaffold11398_cov22-Tisochrysis_lutea.AAC.3
MCLQPDAHKKKLESATARSERLAAEAELAKALEEENEDEGMDGAISIPTLPTSTCDAVVREMGLFVHWGFTATLPEGQLSCCRECNQVNPILKGDRGEGDQA